VYYELLTYGLIQDRTVLQLGFRSRLDSNWEPEDVVLLQVMLCRVKPARLTRRRNGSHTCCPRLAFGNSSGTQSLLL